MPRGDIEVGTTQGDDQRAASRPGNYTCLAENHLNGQQAAHQTFRLNVWYTDPSNPTKAIVIQRAPASHSRGKWIRLVVFLLTFLLACLVFVRSLTRFIARWHRRAK